MYQALKEGIQKALKELGLPETTFSLEHPKELSHGDYMTNVALIVAKQEGKNLVDVAKSISEILEKQNIDGVERIEIAGPGFINFTLKRGIFIKNIINAQDKEWGNTEIYKGKKILVEHSSPNLFKPFHIGHLMNNTIGEAITRLAKVSGATVSVTSFPSDISLGIAKAIFILLEKHLEKPAGDDTLIAGIVGDAYTEGVKRYDDDPEVQERVKEIANNLYERKDSDELKLFENYKFWNVAYFELILKKLGSDIPVSNFIYESEAGIEGKRIVLENVPKVFTESQGAVVYIPDESRKDINTSVFINSQGNPTYEAKDIGLIDLKFNKYNPDISIFITDHEQTSHFKIVLDAMEHINSQWVAKSVHRTHGRMTLRGQRMASRLGGIPLALDIITNLVEEVKTKNSDVTNESAEAIAIASLKFAILRSKAGMNIDFNPETSLSFEGDSGPYLQYTTVRAGTLLEKGKSLGIQPNIDSPVEGTQTLERLVSRFPEIVERAQTEWAPHYIVTYLSELAQQFNSWYGQGKIIDEDKDATAYRLAVVSAVRQTLINGLWVLGISVPEKM